MEMFSNRLKKRRKHLWKWLRSREISCYRLYDRDIPEIPVVVEIFDKYLHIVEYDMPWKDHGEASRDEWVSAVSETAARTLGVQSDRVFFKTKQRRTGTSQHEKLSAESFSPLVYENGLQFIVNMTDYIDVGLFLDQRITREMVRDNAGGAGVLNLFSYTGSFTVYAAAGGAVRSVSVDLSNTYTSWALENMKLNGFTSPAHSFLSEDAFSYLDRIGTAGDQFDIIVLDPPTFSNSKSMDRTLDIQRDHPELINNCLRLLSKDGFLLFSTNFRRFKIQADRIKAGSLQEITLKTIPEDFRDRKVHYAYMLTR
jgi:23S rRNA G2069 N7-methylase RlmK/C1962 C5-methylase RlmI